MYTPRSGVVYSQWSMMETVEVASDAYVYFYPVVQNLKNLFQASIWPHSPAFAPLNQFRHSTKLVDWRFTSVVSPNNDTLYSRAWLDLDKTPMILGLPAVPVMDNNKKRYYSFQIVDGYTYNMKIISPRTTGSWDAASYLITGPSFNGNIPSNFDEDHIITSTSRFTFVLGRTGVYCEEDIQNVEAIQKGYTLTPLAQGEAAGPADVPLFPFIDSAELSKDTPEPQLFFTYVNFIMNYVSVYSDESELMQQFNKICVGPNMTFNGQTMSRVKYEEINVGVTIGAKKIDLAPITEHFGNVSDGWIAAINPPIFGTRTVLKGKYATRAFAAKVGLYGVDPQEAYYPSANKDIDGDTLNSTKNNFTLTFPAGRFPVVGEAGFWSVTMYRLPERLLVQNPIDRYSIGDRTQGLVYANDGSLTLYIQKDKPDTDAKAANWLPAPDPSHEGYKSGLFNVIMRIYWPTKQNVDSVYMPPGIKKADTVVFQSHL